MNSNIRIQAHSENVSRRAPKEEVYFPQTRETVKNVQTCSYSSIILGGIRLAHTPLPHFFAESFVSSLTQPPVSLNVTTSLKSCNASSISCKVICCCVPRFHVGLSSVPSTR